MKNRKLKDYYVDSIYKIKDDIFIKETNKDGYLYRDGKVTNIKASDLPDSYIKVYDYKKNSYINISNVKHLVYIPNYITQHLYKDDFLYISFDKKIEKDLNSFLKVKNYDYILFDNAIIDFIDKLKDFNILDLTDIERELKKKYDWFYNKEDVNLETIIIESNYIGTCKIKLSDVVEALEFSDIENRTYYNKKTNEILWDMDSNKEWSTYKEEHVFNDDIIYMFGFNSRNDYEIIQDFIWTIKNEKVRNKLFNLTRGSGAFRRFKDYVENNSLVDSWYKFRDNKYKLLAQTWCEENNIAYEDDL